MVFCVSPAAKVSVPLVGWKSTPDWAVPPLVANCTVVALFTAGVSLTVKTWLVVPLLPSFDAALLIENVGSSSRIVPVPKAPRPAPWH